MFKSVAKKIFLLLAIRVTYWEAGAEGLQAIPIRLVLIQTARDTLRTVVLRLLFRPRILRQEQFLSTLLIPPNVKAVCRRAARPVHT